jgi:hypothetical protein
MADLLKTLLAAAGAKGKEYFVDPYTQAASTLINSYNPNRVEPQAAATVAPKAASEVISFAQPGVKVPGYNGQAPVSGGYAPWAAATIGQESGGSGWGAVNGSSGAMGAGQVMPETGKALAKRLKMQWRPDLMTGNTEEAKNYQAAISRAALDEAWAAGGGDPAKASTYYHAGPNPKNNGPKTQQYVQDVLGRMGLSVGPTPQPNGAFAATAPILIDPAAVQGMVPGAAQQAPIVLPTAPELLAPEARPMLEAPTKDMLAPLAAAYAPTPVNAERRSAERKGETVSSALQGGLMGLAAGPLGALVGAIYGGLQGNLGARAGERREDSKRDNLARDVAIMLAEAGLKIDESALNVRNQNTDRKWDSSEDRRKVKNQNLLNADERAVKGALVNSDILAKNISAVNEFARLRAQAGLGAVEANAGSLNRAGQTGDELELKNSLASGGVAPDQARRSRMMLAGLGIPWERPEGAKPDPAMDNIRQAASFIAANNVEGALGSFAAELTTSGYAEQVLGDADLKEYKKAVQKKDAARAQMIVQNAITTNPVAALQLADELAKKGLNVAKLISENRSRGTTAQ